MNAVGDEWSGLTTTFRPFASLVYSTGKVSGLVADCARAGASAHVSDTSAAAIALLNTTVLVFSRVHTICNGTNAEQWLRADPPGKAIRFQSDGAPVAYNP